MTIISINEKSIGTCNYKKRHIILKCDECKKQYDCESKYKNRSLKSELHFCSKSCSNKSLNSGLLKLKSKKSLIEKYGSSYVATEEFKLNQKQKCLEKYGVKSRLEAEEILEKIKQTNIKKYGRETFVGSTQHQSQLDYDSISKKGWQTKIKNGNCSKSSVEDRIAKILINDNIKITRQFYIIKQWIDFYLEDLNIYIQVDGVYWHGLNRSLDIISLQKTSQDKKIYKQISRDEKLNQYMKNNNFKLLRITDEQINKMSDTDILKIIKEF